MRILVTSDGLDTLERAADYTTFFIAPTGADLEESTITLLGFCKGGEATDDERRELESLRDKLGQKLGCTIETTLRCGDPSEQILEETKQHEYDLVALGIHLRRRLTRLRPKVVARHLASRLDVPLLIVFPEWNQLRRMLICTGAARKDMPVVRTAGRLASRADAEVTVLHVMSQIPLSADAQVEDLERSATELMQHDSREGVHFERALEILTKVGVPAGRAEAKARHGLVVDEIVRESEEGDFDLIAVGAHHVPSRRSWHELRELIQDDVAERVLLEARRPVLIVPASTTERR
jgi:nucleotide-binding universal stress UspA family protein